MFEEFSPAAFEWSISSPLLLIFLAIFGTLSKYVVMVSNSYVSMTVYNKIMIFNNHNNVQTVVIFCQILHYDEFIVKKLFWPSWSVFSIRVCDILLLYFYSDKTLYSFLRFCDRGTITCYSDINMSYDKEDIDWCWRG